MIINIIRTIDCRTPEQIRMAWKPIKDKPEADSYKDILLPEVLRQLPHIILKNTPVDVFKPRQIEYGKNR